MIGAFNQVQSNSTQNVKEQVKMAEPVTTQQLSMGPMLVILSKVYSLNTSGHTIHGANNYFLHQITSKAEYHSKKLSKGIHYIGALKVMKVFHIGVIILMTSG